MNTLEFINLQKRLGLKILDTETTSWFVTNNNLAISTPSLENSYPNKKDFKCLYKNNIKMAIFMTKSNYNNSCEYIYYGKDYSFDMFNGKVRNQIRKGLKSCVIKKPSIHDLRAQGLKINREILSKHERDVNYLTDAELWNNYCTQMLEEKEVHTYGSYINETLIGYVFFIKVNEKYYIYHPYTSREYSKEAPMNALLFTAINNFIRSDGYVTVSYGLTSFFEKQGLDHFKKGMLFIEQPVTRLIAIHPFLNLFFNQVVNNFFKAISSSKYFGEKYLKYKTLFDANQLYKKHINDNTKI